MGKLTSPSISITFVEQGASAVQRGSRGVVALVLKDTKQQSFKVYGISDIPDTGLTADNVQYIKDALVGYTTAPKYVSVYVMKTATDMSAEYTAMEKFYETEKFNYMAIPTVETDHKTNDVANWIKGLREKDVLVKVVLPNAESADNEGVISWASTLTREGKPLTLEKTTPRIAGLLAGTGMRVSATYAPLRDFEDVNRLTKEERDAAVGAGKLIAYWDGEKVKLSRAVNSFVTTTADKLDSFKKIRLVEVMDMMKDDIRKTIEDDYIGKYTNSYDNKCLLLTAVNGYFKGLIRDEILSAGECEIDVAAVKDWLVSNGKKVVYESGTGVVTKEVKDASDNEIKMADTGSHVFLKAVVSLLDAIEDVTLNIGI